MLRFSGIWRNRPVGRLTLQLSALIMLLFIAIGAILYAIVAVNCMGSANRAVDQTIAADSLEQVPLGVFAAISADGGLKASRDMPPGLPEVAVMRRVQSSHLRQDSRVEMNGTSYRVLTAFHDGKVVQAAVDESDVQEQLNRLLWAMGGAGGALSLLAPSGSFLMARRAMRPLAESLELQRRFTADASHELRTPLTLLSARAQFLRKKLVTKEFSASSEYAVTSVDEILENSRVLSDVLDDLLESVDPRSRNDHRRIELNALAQRAIRLAGPLAQTRSIALDLIKAGAPAHVEGAEVALLRVFTIAISNALDHARSAVRITILTRGTNAIIRVEDDGPGFAEAILDQPIQRNVSFRPQDLPHDQYRHLGVGLALAAEVAKRHGGEVVLGKVSPDGGAMLDVELPLTRSENLATKQSKKAQR